MKSRLIVLSVFLLIIGTLVSCSKVEEQFNSLTSNQIVTDNKQILTTAIVDDNGITHYYEIVTVVDKHNKTTSLVEIVTDKKGEVVKDRRGNFITVTNKENTTTIQSLTSISKQTTQQDASLNYIVTNALDDNDVKFKTSGRSKVTKSKNSSTSKKAKSDNNSKETNKNGFDGKEETTEASTTEKETEKRNIPTEPLTDSEGWLNKWY